jgi:hypothetical protein
MVGKTKSATIALIVIISLVLMTSQNGVHASTNAPSTLTMCIGPTSVLADNNSYNCIFVQLLDSTGKPARAAQDTTVGLSSSLTSIGTVPSTITIPKQSTYVSANFQSTFSPGTTTITASASGFQTVQSTMTTVGPIPSTVAVCGFPSTLPADGNTYNSIMVQLQDSNGYPAKAPIGGVQVTLSCSDANYVGSVTPSVTIPEGMTYTTANFTTVPNNTKIQTATITSVAQGYQSSQFTISTTPVASNPYQLKIFAGSSGLPQVPADGNSYPQVAVELQNATGFVSEASADTFVTMTSTDQTVGKIASQLDIRAGQCYAVATLNSTYKAGTITITAVATNLVMYQQEIATYGFTPSKLAVFCVPSALPSDNSTYSAVTVQLQDAEGRPAKDPTQAVIVDLFSSQPTVGSVTATLTIPFGQTQATGAISVTNSPGTTSITAQAQSYQNSQAATTTYFIDFLPLQVTLKPDTSTLSNGGQTNITTYIAANGAPVTGATITFASDSGGTFTTTKETGNGYYNTVFTATSFTKSATCTITATATKTGYANSQATIQITVQPPTSTSTSDPNSTPDSTQSSSSASSGPPTIQLHVEDSQGNPLRGANVASTIQPDGMKTLSGTTNSTGYIVFQNATAGNYTFAISAKGCYQTFAHVEFSGQPTTVTQKLSADAADSASHGISLSTILIVAVIVVIAVVIVVILVKRRSSSPADTPTSTY